MTMLHFCPGLAVLTAGATASQGNQPIWTGAAIATVVAAALAFLASLLTLRSQRKLTLSQEAHQQKLTNQQLEHEARLEQVTRSFALRQRDIDYRVRQLNELYGPLRMLRATNDRLRKSLPASERNGAPWRLVKHIPEAKADLGMTTIVKEILQINRQIRDLLITKAGLMEAEPVPESFERFMHHEALLSLAWEQGTDFVLAGVGLTRVSDVPFPN